MVPGNALHLCSALMCRCRGPPPVWDRLKGRSSWRWCPWCPGSAPSPFTVSSSPTPPPFTIPLSPAPSSLLPGGGPPAFFPLVAGLFGDGLGSDVLGVLDVLPWVDGVLVIVSLIVLPRSWAVSVLVIVTLIALPGSARHVLGIWRINHHDVGWCQGTLCTCALH